MAQTSSSPSITEEKPINTIILDSSPLILNTPSISTLLANGHTFVTTPSVLSEIRGGEARSRIDTLYMPFLTVRGPKSESIRFVKDFARKTGDGAVLSQTDFEVLALAYDIECERNGGNWRLRSVPGQKRLNGSPPSKEAQQSSSAQSEPEQPGSVDSESVQTPTEVATIAVADLESKTEGLALEDTAEPTQPVDAELPTTDDPTEESESIEQEERSEDVPNASTAVVEGSDSDEGWITPANIKKKKAKDEAASSKSQSGTKHLQVATMTGDFAMQNVLLQMNLNLLSTKTCQRISQIRQFILRCHGCFSTTKDMSKQFCPRCGKPTLTRVSCTTNDKGEVKLHLKANMQWNNKGNVFSIPKPASGTSNQKWKGPKQGGGQGGWGNDLILAEDQKEYIRAMSTMKRSKERDLMDEDTLPSILSGNRNHGSGKIQVGGGRTINSRKR